MSHARVLASLVTASLLAAGVARAEEKVVKKSEHKEAHAEDHKESHGEGKAEAHAEAHAEASARVEVSENGRKVEGGGEALPADMREKLEKWKQEAERKHQEFRKKFEEKKAGMPAGRGPKRGAAPCDPADEPKEAGKPKCGGGEDPEEAADPNDDDVTRRVKKLERELKKGDRGADGKPKDECGKPGDKPSVKPEGSKRVAPAK